MEHTRPSVLSRMFRQTPEGESHLRRFTYRIAIPFVERVLSFPESLFAIDIMNEPDWLWGSDTIASVTAEFSESDILPAIQFIGRQIRNEFRDRILISVGWGTSHAPYSYQRTPILDFVDFYDAHCYNHGELADMIPNAPVASSLDKPFIMGEFGLSGERDRFWGNTIAQSSGESNFSFGRLCSLQAAQCGMHLQTAYDRGYIGAFIWEYGFRLGPVHPNDRVRNRLSSLSPPVPHWKDRYSCFFTNDSGGLEKRQIVEVLRNFTHPRTRFTNIRQIQELDE